MPGGLYLLRGPRWVGKSVEVKETPSTRIASSCRCRFGTSSVLRVAAPRRTGSVTWPSPLSLRDALAGATREIVPWMDDLVLDYDAVLHHRTPTRKEVDFVGPHFGGVAIESKYVSGDRWRRAVPTLKASRWRGIVATRDALDLRDPEAMAVPAGMLAWLVGG